MEQASPTNPTNRGKLASCLSSLTSSTTTAMLMLAIITLVALSFAIHGPELPRTISIPTLLLIAATLTYRYLKRNTAPANRAERRRNPSAAPEAQAHPRHPVLTAAYAITNAALAGMLLLMAVVYADVRIFP